MIQSPLTMIEWRLDSEVALLVDEKDLVVWPHGVLGQSWDGSGIAVDGKKDEYHQAGPEFMTSANMEGAIEGSLQDYAVGGEFGVDFKFSRFGVYVPTPPRDVSKLSGNKRKSSTRLAAATAVSALGAV